MKTNVPIKFILSLIVLILFLGCSNKKKEKNKVNSNLDTTTSQELEFAQKRIVYQIPEMKDVICHNGVVYHSVNGIDLKADIYIPPTHDKSNTLPLVIIVDGYPDSRINQSQGQDGKDLQMAVSWSELIAASGMAAVTYQTQFSHSETDSLIYFLKKNAKDYNLDMSNLCVFGGSANTLAAQSLMQNDDYNIKCAVLYYGILLTPDQKYYAAIDSTAKKFGFYFSDLRNISRIPESIPILVTRAGMDKYPIVKKTTDYFVAEAIKSNARINFTNYPEGQHDFDVLDDTETSKLIIRQTVDFMKTHLLYK